jgi:hypothetical protein
MIHHSIIHLPTLLDDGALRLRRLEKARSFQSLLGVHLGAFDKCR